MKKILVTGGLGYIGSHTVVALIEHGYEVCIVDDNSRSLPWIAKQISQIVKKEISYHKINICNYEALSEIFKKEKDIAGVIHFAAYIYVNESVKEPLKYYHNNILGLLNILQCMEEHCIKNLVFSSSCTVYGNPITIPVTEDTPLAEPISPYGKTKWMSEKVLYDVVQRKKIQVVSLRYFNPIGAHASGLIGEIPHGIPEHIVPYITQTAIGTREKLTIFGNDYPTRDGTCIRDYIHVCDLAEAHSKAIDYMMNQSLHNNWDVFNLGSGNGFSVKEIVEAFIQATGIQLRYEFGKRREGDIAAIYANNDKARSILQWNPIRTIEDMMGSAWNWEKYLAKKIVR